jgi:AAA family ATP:ADP antiporter
VADGADSERRGRGIGFWRIFGDVRRGEGTRVALLGLQIFLLLSAYYLLKTVREPLILLSRFRGLGGAELKIYATSAQALLLLAVLPLYARLASRVSRLVLIYFTLIAFILSLGLFIALGAAGKPIAAPFYMWLGIVSLLGIAQFWSLAVDLYSREAGERLFGVIAIGGAAGAIAGSQLARRLIEPLGIYGLMAMAGALYALALAIVTIIDGKPAATDGEAPRRAPAAASTGSLGLVMRDRYLLLIGALLIFVNLVNTQGEYILADAVKTHAEAFPSVARQAIIGRFYGAFYGAVNALAFIVQSFLVARLLKVGGTRRALFLLPCVALAGYGAIALFPSLVVIALAKAAENSFDYSIETTVEQTLFLPTTREIKYNGKATVDTICVRLGDLAAGGLVMICLHVFSLSRRGFAVANLALVAIWMAIAVAIARRHRVLAGDGPVRTPRRPSPVQPVTVEVEPATDPDFDPTVIRR